MKKWISVFLALAMLAATGCGSSSSGGSGGNAGSAPQTGSETSPAQSAGGAEGGIGAPGQPVTVSFLIKDVPPTEEGVILLKEKIEEKMAAQGQYVSLEFLEAPSGTYAEAVPLALRTGQIAPDVVYFQGVQGTSGPDLPIANEGLLEDLTPYIANSTYVKSLMQGHNIARMENYPYLLWLAPARIQVPVIRSDWFNSLDSKNALLADPSPDNFYNMFKEIKDKGIADYAISSDGSLARYDSVFNHAFGVTSTFMKVDGKWVSSKVTEFEKQKLAFYNKLYTDGLLDPEYITNQWDGMEQKFYEGNVAMLAATAGGVVQIYDNKMTATNGPEAMLTVLPPAKGISQAYLSVDTTKESRGLAITADSEVKDAAFAILEFMASPEGRMLDKLGIEGVHYNIENGKIVTTQRFSEWWARFWDTTYKFDPGMPFETEPFSQPTLDSLAIINEYYHEDINVLIPEHLQASWDGMEMLYREYAADIVRGVQPVDSFDKFVSEWNAAGGTALSDYLATVLN